MNPVQRLRLNADHDRIKQLMQAGALAGKLELLSAASALQTRWRFRLHVRTAANDQFPAGALASCTLEIRLGAQYPFQAPTAHLDPVPFHPNVFPAGVICLGGQWLPSEGMDLFITRIAKLLSFDPLLVNTQSPANSQAARWYKQQCRNRPELFPSDPLNSAPARISCACPQCKVNLRLPKGRSGEVECPRCQHSFAVST
jgi:Ubiquitin-conjugating enzyme